MSGFLAVKPTDKAVIAEPERQIPQLVKTKPQVVTMDMPDLGILNELMKTDHVHDILVNGTHGVFIDQGGELVDTGLSFESEQDVMKVADAIMKTMNVRWDPERPVIDTRLPDGSRVNIVAPPMAVDGTTISIRKFPNLRITLDSMTENKQITPEISQFLKLCTAQRMNLIVSGATSSGKTTLLGALSSAISPKERIVTIEDSAELRLQQPHVVRLESKQPKSLDAQHTGVSIRDLVKNALRMRPDRIIVGESRGPEAFDIIQAMNTGHDGSMTTLHANAPRDALSRLETMIQMAMPQMTTRVVRQQIAATVNLILQMARGKDGTRRITHISEIVGMEGEVIVLQDLILWQEANGNKPAEYRWVTTAPRNMNITDAARQAGLIRGMR
jgi:pilus assembly protein CpaF